MNRPLGSLVLLSLSLCLAACAGGKQKAPKCKGPYERINAAEHYIAPTKKEPAP